jgi:hypothetical protein
LVKSIAVCCIILAGCAFAAQAQTPPGQAARSRVDGVIANAYQSASAGFPCKVKSGGKPNMMRWETIGECLAKAYENVDWEEVSQRLQDIRKEFGLQAGEILSLAESSLASHALTFDRVFVVKDTRALLPLSNPVLKFLPDNSLQNLPVIEKALKKQVGTFTGTYEFERTGDVSGNKTRLVLFQFTDPKGDIHSAAERLLLDRYGVPWKEAMSQPGFRLPPDKILLK